MSISEKDALQISFWQQAKEKLVEKVQLGDWTFLTGIVTNGSIPVVQEIIRYAINQDNFPAMKNLSPYLGGKGHGPWKLTNLKKKGVLANTVSGSRVVPGEWSLTPLLFKNLLDVSSGFKILDWQPSKKEKRLVRSSSSKGQLIWNYLQKVRVSDRLLVTSELVEEMAQEVETVKTYVWDTLREFQKKNLTKNDSQGQGKGIMLTFLKKESEAKQPMIQTGSILETLEREIRKLETQKISANNEIAKQTKKLEEIEISLSQKSLVRDEIKRLAEITSI